LGRLRMKFNKSQSQSKLGAFCYGGVLFCMDLCVSIFAHVEI
jgi:hypothetical protein